jgi:hypothetical protein
MSGPNIVSEAAKHITKTAPSRGLSPSRPAPSSQMAAPRPQSPLSPRYDNGRFEMLQPPSPRAIHSRSQGNSQRRANTGSLKLPSLPRYHPANYPSANSSLQTTPDAGNMGSPQPPMSPRSHQKVINDAQKHLFLYQRELLNAARSQSPNQVDRPVSPRLAPMGSPGPVTPLELEGEEGYLIAGARSAGQEAVSSNELVEKLIREEAAAARRRKSGENASTHGGR